MTIKTEMNNKQVTKISEGKNMNKTIHKDNKETITSQVEIRKIETTERGTKKEIEDKNSRETQKEIKMKLAQKLK